MSTIVVGYDQTPGSQTALERAATLAKALDSKLVVTSVTPMMMSAGRSGGPIDPTDPPEKHAKELAVGTRPIWRAQGIPRPTIRRGRRAAGRDRPARRRAERRHDRGRDARARDDQSPARCERQRRGVASRALRRVDRARSARLAGGLRLTRRFAASVGCGAAGPIGEARMPSGPSPHPCAPSGQGSHRLRAPADARGSGDRRLAVPHPGPSCGCAMFIVERVHG